MNRLWNHPQTPGVAGEIVKWLWDETCADANIIVDLHCLQAEKPLIFNSFEKFPENFSFKPDAGRLGRARMPPAGVFGPR